MPCIRLTIINVNAVAAIHGKNGTTFVPGTTSSGIEGT